MINDNDLKGAIVMMHPQMWGEHADKAGVIGEITKADIARDDFYVNYGGQQDHLHSADAMLILKPPGDIYDYMHHHAISLSVQDFKDLKTIARLLDHGSSGHIRTAMEVVQKNEGIHFAATNGLDDLLGMKQKQGLKR